MDSADMMIQLLYRLWTICVNGETNVGTMGTCESIFITRNTRATIFLLRIPSTDITRMISSKTLVTKHEFMSAHQQLLIPWTGHVTSIETPIWSTISHPGKYLFHLPAPTFLTVNTVLTNMGIMGIQIESTVSTTEDTVLGSGNAVF